MAGVQPAAPPHCPHCLLPHLPRSTDGTGPSRHQVKEEGVGARSPNLESWEPCPEDSSQGVGSPHPGPEDLLVSSLSFPWLRLAPAPAYRERCALWGAPGMTGQCAWHRGSEGLLPGARPGVGLLTFPVRQSGLVGSPGLALGLGLARSPGAAQAW